jgi:hypothetical protein
VRATLLLDGVLRDFHIDGAITLAAQPATPPASAP